MHSQDIAGGKSARKGDSGVNENEFKCERFLYGNVYIFANRDRNLETEIISWNTEFYVKSNPADDDC